MHNPDALPITVLMPVYNGEAYLREAIDSILNQTFREFEFLIINDGSTDNTEEIVLSYRDDRIRYIKNEKNLRLIATLNKGIALANGNYIARMDADDISLPQRLQIQLNYLQQHPDVALCGSWFEAFGATQVVGRYLPEHDGIMFQMLYQCHLCHPSVMVRKSDLLRMELLFDPAFAHAEDYDLFTRLGHRFRLANMQEVLIRYRIHGGSVSATYKAVQEANSQIIRHRGFAWLGYPISDSLLADFIALNHQSYSDIRSSANELKNFFEGLLTANRESNMFSQAFLLQKLQDLWFHYCYHRASVTDFYSSGLLSGNRSVGFLTRLKWMIKNRQQA